MASSAGNRMLMGLPRDLLSSEVPSEPAPSVAPATPPTLTTPPADFRWIH